MFRRMTAAAVFMGLLMLGATARAADQDDVKAAALAFAKVLEAGNAADVKAACTGTDKEMAIVDGMVEVLGAMKSLSRAAVAKFGDAGKGIMQEQENPGEQIKKQVESAEIKIEGDNATITAKGEGEPLKLKKVDGKWKINLDAMPNKDEMEKAGPMMKAMVKACNETITDIKADKYKTVDEAKTALGMKMMAAMTGAAPATQPAKE